MQHQEISKSSLLYRDRVVCVVRVVLRIEKDYIQLWGIVPNRMNMANISVLDDGFPKRGDSTIDPKILWSLLWPKRHPDFWETLNP